MTVSYILLNIVLLFANVKVFFYNLKTKKIFTLLNMGLFITLLGIYFSLLIIENGNWIGEQSDYGRLNFSSVYLLLFLLLVNLYVFKIKKNDSLIDKKLLVKPIMSYSKSYSYIITILLSIYFLINITVASIYGNGKLDLFGKFEYSKILLIISMYYNGIIPFIVLRLHKSMRLYAIMIIALNGFALTSTFGLLFTLITPLGIIFYKETIKNSFKKVSFKQKMLLLFAFLFMLSLVVFLKYRQLDSSLDYFFERYVVQGQLFYGSINHQFNGDIQYQFDHYLNGMFNTNFVISKDYGFGYLMILISGNIAENYIDVLNIRMTSGMPAILIVNFGLVLSFLLFAIILHFYKFYLKFYINSLMSDNIILFLIMSRITYYVGEFLFMGEYGALNINFFVSIIAYIILKNLFKTKYKFRLTSK